MKTLFGNKDEIIKLKLESTSYVSWTLTDRQICDLELILNGAFFPLKGFMDEKNYISVLENMRLQNGLLWPMPITLDVSDDFMKKIVLNDKITLKDKEGFSLAILTISDIWKPNFDYEAEAIYKTLDRSHPGLHYLYNIGYKNYVGGRLEGISLPRYYDYKELRHSPESLKKEFEKLGWKKIIAFQTRNPLHKAHVEMTLKSLKAHKAKLLIHPVVGLTKTGDVDHHTRVRCYKHVIKKYDKGTALLSLLPLAMRMGGPREALWHALIRKNYGCTHFIVGRDHAGPGYDKNKKPFYGSYDAQKILLKYENEIGIKMIAFKFMVYIPETKKYKSIDETSKNEKYKTVSGTQLRNLLDKGIGVPEWFTYPEVSKELELTRPPLTKRGFTIFFTGLSGSGKSTLANGLLVKLMEEGSRPVTLLDGDIVRAHLSSELGFSKEHRSLNVQRIGFVASEITKNGGIAICAPIAPYESDRKFNRDLISETGSFIEVFVNTPLEKCEERDSKGLYALARKGIIKEFTGISDPYEEPINPELVINSSNETPENLVDKIYEKIKLKGYIK
ncbi:MAG: bifunctional sulfate adenylyltransferase/adenylylsulfate kinase [Candidatus Neomarinimicrobiota bacterium]